jgi:hypothetical protein
MMLTQAEQRILGEAATVETRAAIQSELDTLKLPRQRRFTAAALLVGSPEFQRQ